MSVTTYRDPSLVAGQSTVVVTPTTPLPVTFSGGVTTSENLAQIGGNTIDSNSGVKSAGTLRVVLATDQPQLTAALKVDGSAVNQPVTGTFWQVTQPVSGTFWQATQPVSGTFWQATQPVSIASMPSTPVTGTFFQAKQPIDGTTASGSSVSDPPVTIGGRASTTNPTAVADGQVVNVMLSKRGQVVTSDGAPRELRGSQKTTLSNSTSEVTIVTAGSAGVFNDLYGLILANTGAATTKVDIRDASAGTIIMTIEVPTLETRGIMMPASSALSQTTAANNWTAQCTSATTAMEVTALYIKQV